MLKPESKFHNEPKYNAIIASRDSLFGSLRPPYAQEILKITESLQTPVGDQAVVGLLLTYIDVQIVRTLIPVLIKQNVIFELIMTSLSQVVQDYFSGLTDQAFFNLYNIIADFGNEITPHFANFIISFLGEITFQRSQIIAANFINHFSRIKNIEPYIRKSPKFHAFLIFKCLRFLQEIETLKVSQDVDANVKLDNQFNVIPGKLRLILGQLFKLPPHYPEFFGREILRFIYDKPLQSEFKLSCDTEKLMKCASPEFTRLTVPCWARYIMNSIAQAPEKVISFTSSMFDNSIPDIIPFLAADCIRYINSSNKIDSKIKTKMILGILQVLSDKFLIPIDIFEINIAISLDALTYTRESKEDDQAIRSFYVIAEKINIVPFLEKIASRDASMRLGLAESIARSGSSIKFVNLKLPEVTPEQPKIDGKEAIDKTLERIKWQQKDAPAILNQLAEQLISNILPYDFTLPFEENPDIQVIIDTGNPKVIAPVCTKNPALFKYTIYSLVSNPNLLKDVLINVFESEESSIAFPVLSKILVLIPEVLPTIAEVLPHIHLNETVDSSTFIKYMCANCTGKEIFVLTKTPIFPVDKILITALMKDSFKWRDVMQASFWNIISNILSDPNYTDNILNAICALVDFFPNYPIALISMKRIIMRCNPTNHHFGKLLCALIKRNDVTQAIALQFLKSWSIISVDSTKTIIQKKYKTIKDFYDKSSSTMQSQFPDIVNTTLKSK